MKRFIALAIIWLIKKISIWLSIFFTEIFRVLLENTIQKFYNWLDQKKYGKHAR